MPNFSFAQNALKMNIFKSTFLLSLLFIAIKILGFFEKIVLAHFFGTSDAADVYFWALSIPFALYLIIEEILGPVFIPFLVEKIGLDETSAAKRIMNILFVILACVMTMLCIAGIYFSPFLVEMLAPGFEGEKQNTAISILQGLFVIFIFLGLNSYLTVIYHAYKRFNLPVLARAVQKVLIIILIMLWGKSYGVYSAVIGTVVGCVIQTIILIIFLPKKYRKTKLPSASVEVDTSKRLVLLMMPLFLGVAFSQLSGIIDNLVVSGQFSGAVASLSFGRKIIDLPILIVPFALGIVLLPYFSSLNNPEQNQEFAAIFEKVIRLLTILFLFITLVVLLFNQMIVSILFERGQFDSNSTEITARALFWFSFGLLAFALEIPIMQSFFALKNTFTPIWIGICCASLNIVLTVILVQYLGFIIVPIALTLQKSIKTGWLYWKLQLKIPIKTKDILAFFFRNLIAASGAVLLFFLVRSGANVIVEWQLPLYLNFMASVIALFICYVAMLRVFRIREAVDTLMILKTRSLK